MEAQILSRLKYAKFASTTVCINELVTILSILNVIKIRRFFGEITRSFLLKRL